MPSLRWWRGPMFGFLHRVSVLSTLMGETRLMPQAEKGPLKCFYPPIRHMKSASWSNHPPSGDKDLCCWARKRIAHNFCTFGPIGVTLNRLGLYQSPKERSQDFILCPVEDGAPNRYALNFRGRSFWGRNHLITGLLFELGGGVAQFRISQGLTCTDKGRKASGIDRWCTGVSLTPILASSRGHLLGTVTINIFAERWLVVN